MDAQVSAIEEKFVMHRRTVDGWKSEEEDEGTICKEENASAKA